MMDLDLGRRWVLGSQIGGGGFGEVYSATCDGDEVAVKLVPKSPGAQRELLFVELGGTPNVVPIIDQGETDSHFALVMPKADTSLKEHLEKAGGVLGVSEVRQVMTDVAETLAALAERDAPVVHRDLKPANVLRLDGRWCLADFGIARFAEATTASDTHKFAQSHPYAAPERWRAERATSATDVYSLGIMAYEMLTGTRPFTGPRVEDYRDQHLHRPPAPMVDAPASMAALVEEMIDKAPEARPTPANLLRRLRRMEERAHQPGTLASLEEANQAEVRRRLEEGAAEAAAATEAERRRQLATAASRGLDRIADELFAALLDAAPAAEADGDLRRMGWSRLTLGAASLTLTRVGWSGDPWENATPPVFDVVEAAVLDLRTPRTSSGYEGRSHSLWYCDAQRSGEYKWYEVSFMMNPFSRRESAQEPFALRPGRGAADAVGSGINATQVAWPFTELVVGELDEFIERWSEWFARAATNKLNHPSHMPERDIGGSWRTS